jgi:hypothetical protein
VRREKPSLRHNRARARLISGFVRLTGSSTLYRTLAPLLTPEYRSLAGPIAEGDRGRAWQHRLIGCLEPRLLEFPFGQRWRMARKLWRRWAPRPGVAPRPDPLRHGDRETRDAFELGCLQHGWSPELGREHPGVALGVGWLKQDRSRILAEIARVEYASEQAGLRTG